MTLEEASQMFEIDAQYLPNIMAIPNSEDKENPKILEFEFSKGASDLK